MTSDTIPAWLRPMAELAGSVKADTLSPMFARPPADARPAAVLVLFSEGIDGPELLLTQRATTLRNHAGQFSFPGGRTDPGDDGPVGTALREAEEEVGLDPTTVEVIGTLPSLWLPPSNHAVTPVLAYWREPSLLTPVNDAEVGRIVHQPIDVLIDPVNRFSVRHPTGWKGPAFDLGVDTPLWGFTAGLISRLFEQAGWARPWDTSVIRVLPELL